MTDLPKMPKIQWNWVEFNYDAVMKQVELKIMQKFLQTMIKAPYGSCKMVVPRLSNCVRFTDWILQGLSQKERDFFVVALFSVAHTM